MERKETFEELLELAKGNLTEEQDLLLRYYFSIGCEE